MGAAESKRGRWSGKTGMYVRKDVLNYNAIMTIENTYKVLMFHRQNSFQCDFCFNSRTALGLIPLYSFYLGF